VLPDLRLAITSLTEDPLAPDYLSVLARWIVGSALLVAGVAKLRARSEHASTIAAYEVLPRALTPVVGVVLPWIESALGVALVLGAASALASAAAAALLAVFTAVIGWNLARGNRVECGCFGDLSSERIGPSTLVRTGLLLLTALTAAQLPSAYLSVELLREGSNPTLPPAVDGVWLALLSTVGIALYVASATGVRVLMADRRPQEEQP
jgi:uncharacterized membrane protein YphA (DoxX/SURF4 family)